MTKLTNHELRYEIKYDLYKNFPNNKKQTYILNF